MEFLSYFHPLHPKVVHFPIALFISALGFEVASLVFQKETLHRTALQIYILAVLATPFVILSGLEEAEHLNLKHPILNLHRQFAFLTMYTSLASLPILWFIKNNKRIFRIVFLSFILLVVIFVSTTAHHGGRMVYEYGVGMEK